MQLGAGSLIPANLKMQVYLLKAIRLPSPARGRSVSSDAPRKGTYPELDGRGGGVWGTLQPGQVGMRTASCVGAVWSPSFSSCPPHAANISSNSAPQARCDMHELPYSAPSAQTVLVRSNHR